MPDMIRYMFLDANGVCTNILREMNALLKQLSSSARDMDLRYLFMTAHRSHMLIACDEKQTTLPVIGMATLSLVHKPTALEGRIDDVVVHDDYRGRSIGKELIRLLLEKSRELDCSYVELTSSPHREAANALYRKLGFEQRSTNVYRFGL